MQKVGLMSKTGLEGKTVVITGASRGIGRAIALKCARDGANIVIAAKSVEPHPKFAGTIFTVAKEAMAVGGKVLPIQVDVRFEEQVQAMVQKTVEKFGRIDVLVNNAGAISLTNTPDTPMKRYDLIQAVNVRATFLCTQAVLPFLKKSDNPHVLNLAPPINLHPRWLKDHLAYTISKYGMTMCTLGMAAEFQEEGIAVNALWPKTLIATAAIDLLLGETGRQQCRSPEIMADAAYAIITTNSRQLTGETLIDEDFLRSHGVDNFDSYALSPNAELLPDLFLSS